MLRGGDKSGKVISCGHRDHNTHQTVPSLLYIWSGARRFQSRYTEYNIYGDMIYMLWRSARRRDDHDNYVDVTLPSPDSTCNLQPEVLLRLVIS